MAELIRRRKRSHPTWKGRFVRAPQRGDRAQRAVVAVRLVPRGARGVRSMAVATGLELRYMEKGDRGHEAYALYQAQDHGVDSTAFADRTRQDPHQWRLMFAPERRADVDLTQVTRQTLDQMARDTGYRLDWVGVNHYDTAHPHSHVVVRGLDADGQVVGLKRDYLTHGLRYRLQDVLTQELGPRPLEPRLERHVGQDHTMAPARDLDAVWDRPVLGNRLSGIYHTPEQKNYGDMRPDNQVRFWTERAAMEAGFRRAENDHYGPGTGLARTMPDPAALERETLDPGRLVGAAAQSVGRGLGLGSVLPREAPVGPGLRARLDPDQDRER